MLMVEVRIRPATATDMEPMLALLQALFAIEADFVGDAAKQRRGLAQLLSQGDRSCLLVAEHEGKVIGMCSLQILVSTAEGGEVGLIEDMVVAEPWRGQGIGGQLLTAMEQWARERGLTRLQLLAERDNLPALGFYSTMDWTETQLFALRKHPHE